MRLVGATLAALLLQQAPRPAPASIKSVVVTVGTLQSVAKVIVHLSGGDRSGPLAVATGAHGRFEFQNLTPGSYQLTAARSGYLNTAFGQRGPSGTGHNLTIEAGVNLNDVRLLMTPTGAISGRVFDNTGEPLANVPVQALKYAYAEGQRTLTQVKVDETNDLGEFRIFWLPPGQYYISAQPRDGTFGKVFMLHDGDSQGTGFVSGKSININGTEVHSQFQQLGEAYVPVYYPGTADPKSASRVEVRPGADVRGIDFAIA